MPSHIPIACSLTAAEMPVRLAEMAALGRLALVDVYREGHRAELRFAAGTGIRTRVEDIVAAESQCCAFLDMRISDELDTVVLSIAAPEAAELVLAEIVEAFAGHERAA